MVEQRRFSRAPINIPLTFSLKGSPDERFEGVGKDIAVGGMFVETSTPANFAADVVIVIRLPGAAQWMSLPGIVRWVRGDGMGIQFGLIGALETHVITEINRKHAEGAPSE